MEAMRSSHSVSESVRFARQTSPRITLSHILLFIITSVLAVALAAAYVVAAAATTYVSAKGTCCQYLKASSLSGKVLSPADIRYKYAIQGFFSGQSRDDAPTCIIQPSSADDVAAAVKMLVARSCKFSIKGGGHTAWAGAASIDGGVTIDMVNIATTTLNANKSVASIGAGSRWGQVYDTLIPQRVMVAGGRDSTVGVGGLILGGGYSWFAPVRGFVCDSVVNFELVDATGCIINANESTNPDLFLALKGGSNNFGIITRYDMAAFPQGDLWGGVMTYPETTGPQQIAAFTNFTDHIKDDKAANIITIWSYQQAAGASVILNALDYTKPTPYPAAYNQFFAIEPVVTSTMRVANITSLTDELAAATIQNERYLFVTATFQNNAEMYHTAVNISNAYLEPHKNTTGLVWTLLFQPIPRIVSDASVASGGNIMGVDSNTGNLMLFLIFITWEQPSDDDVLTSVAYAALADIKAAGAALGVNVPYIYLNYAGKDQDVLSNYGAANKKKMAKVSAKYDPEGVFQNLVPGGWKIGNSAGSGDSIRNA